MKRNFDKKLEKLENKKRKIKSFIDLIDATNTDYKNKCINGNESEEQMNGNSCDDNDVVFTSSFKQMSELRKKLSIKLTTERPKIFVENEYLINDSSDEPIEPKCLTVEDIQQLVLATLLPPPRLSCPPNWCKVFKPTKASKVSIFVIDFESNEELFNEKDFKHSVKFDPKDDWINCLLNVRLSNRQMEKMHKKVKSNANSNPIDISSEERVSRTDLLLSSVQMSIEKYPLIEEQSWSKTKSKYYPVTDSSPIFSIDCEMCYTTADRLEVTRISVVDQNCSVIYDTLVKPKNRIKNYLTKFSGITKKLLDPIDVTLEDVHKELDRILPEDAILCGQSLNSDLQALQLIHPYIIDTSVIYNLSGYRPVKASLKQLSQKFLNMSIQNDSSGHDSAEDAVAAMKLVQLKLSMGLEFGDRCLSKSQRWEGCYDEHSLSMSITNYLDTFNTKLTVFYDYSDIDSYDKSLVIYSHSVQRCAQLSETINRSILRDKEICVVINKNGKCFIKF